MLVTKRYIFLCVFFLKVSSGEINLPRRHPTRLKRQDDEQWSWGSSDVAKSNNIDIVPETTTEGPNPCFPVDPPVAPNFTAPGRRVSQVKCFEYMWTIRVLTDEAKKNEECAELLLDIIGGRDAVLQEFPHMAAIGWKAVQGTWLFKCGGSLISNKFVLTAGHCSRASDRDSSIAELVPKIVRLGQNSIDTLTTGQDMNILRIINHPNYKPPKKYFDIALIELEKPVIINEYVQPACLHVGPDNTLVGQKAIITGWGIIEAGGFKTSAELQTAEVDVLDSRLCDRVYRRTCNRLWCNMTSNQLCAGNIAGGVDACQGDSGGPLQIKFALPKNSQHQNNIYRIIGVTSFGIGCALPNVPGIYTRVSSFLDWIEPIVWP